MAILFGIKGRFTGSDAGEGVYELSDIGHAVLEQVAHARGTL